MTSLKRLVLRLPLKQVSENAKQPASAKTNNCLPKCSLPSNAYLHFIFYFTNKEVFYVKQWALKCFKPLVVYATGRSKAVVLVLFLFLPWLHGFYHFVLSIAFSLFYCFVQSCLALWSPRLGKRELVYVFLMLLYVYFAHVKFFPFFSSSWCQGLAATCACGTPWTILLFLYKRNS